MSEGVRFAPSPTGRFHLGNLRSAWISYQWAKILEQPWVVRFEDIDAPRRIPGAMENQLADMAELGLRPDKVYVQSSRVARHKELFGRAVKDGVVYPCLCSRKEVQDAIAASASAPHGGREAVYSGRCRHGGGQKVVTGRLVGWRFRMPRQDGSEDFIVGRTDMSGEYFPSYQWACAIDDWDGHYSLLVRAWDLECAVVQQRSIQRWIKDQEKSAGGYPAVFHCSLVVQNSGQRLEKRTQGLTLPELLSRGWTAKTIVEKFRDSFSFDETTGHQFSVGKVFGEKKRKITLGEMGFN